MGTSMFQPVVESFMPQVVMQVTVLPTCHWIVMRIVVNDLSIESAVLQISVMRPVIDTGRPVVSIGKREMDATLCRSVWCQGCQCATGD